MKRRGFLQSLAGLIGLASAPSIPAKQKPTIVNAEPGIYVNGKKVEPPINVSDATTKTSESNFSHLTIKDFGAWNTKCLSVDSLTPDGHLTKRYIDRMITGINWLPSDGLFPTKAMVGDAFNFEPKTYRTYPLDQLTISRLEGGYIFNGVTWQHFIGMVRTDSF